MYVIELNFNVKVKVASCNIFHLSLSVSCVNSKIHNLFIVCPRIAPHLTNESDSGISVSSGKIRSLTLFVTRNKCQVTSYKKL